MVSTKILRINTAYFSMKLYVSYFGVQFLNRRSRMTVFFKELGVGYDDCYNLGPSSHPRGLRSPSEVEGESKPILVQNIILCLFPLLLLHLHVFM